MTTKRILIALSLALAVLAAISCRREKVASHYPGAPVIVISIDTLRADHLPAFGYTQVETPAIDSLRRDSILFTNAWSHVPLTFPSHVSMLTGLLPPAHNVRNNIGYHLEPSIPTMPKALKEKGYATGAAVSAYVLRGNVGLSSSFDFYDDGIVSRANVPVGALQRNGAETSEIAKRWVGEHKGKPFFFLLHLFEPHAPYEPPEPFRSRFANAYDGEIATADHIVGDFLEQLKRDGTYDDAIIILMSDHGEGLNQHGEPEHGVFLYRESIHVPLFLKLPKGARGGDTDASVVGLVDIFPTIAALTDAKTPANLAGKSLLHHDENDSRRRIYSESLYSRIHLGWSELRSLAGADYHFIEAPKPELYDVAKDPGETHNILADERRVYASMRDELAKYGSAINLPAHVDPEEAKKLTALGYLGSSAPRPTGPLPDPKDRIGEITAMIDAMRLVREEKHNEAVEALKKILEKNPRLADAWNQMGTSYEMAGRYEEAAGAYRKAIELTPELAGEFGLRLGSILLRLERFDEAEKHAKLGEKTNYGGSHLLLARIKLAQKQFPAAEQAARVAEGDEFSHIAAQVLLAQIYAQQDRAKEALTIVNEVTAEGQRRKLGDIESLDYVRGDSLARLGRYPEAIESLQREIAHFPHNRQSYASLYLVYMLTNRPDEADEALEQMVRANPNKRAVLFAAHTAEAIGDQRGAALWRQRAAALR